MNINKIEFDTTGKQSLINRIKTMGRPGSKLISVYNGFSTKEYNQISDEKNMDIITFFRNGEWEAEAKLVY